MGKLIELLNECKPTVSCANFKEHYEFIDDDIYLIREGIDGEEEHFPMYVCYKKGDFVKWLVENEKIDLRKIKKLCRKSNEHSIHTYPIMYEYSDLECLLMLLAISDTPIEDLCGYLKDDATEKVDTLLKGIKKSCESLGI